MHQTFHQFTELHRSKTMHQFKQKTMHPPVPDQHCRKTTWQNASITKKKHPTASVCQPVIQDNFTVLLDILKSWTSKSWSVHLCHLAFSYCVAWQPYYVFLTQIKGSKQTKVTTCSSESSIANFTAPSLVCYDIILKTKQPAADFCQLLLIYVA